MMLPTQDRSRLQYGVLDVTSMQLHEDTANSKSFNPKSLVSLITTCCLLQAKKSRQAKLCFTVSKSFM